MFDSTAEWTEMRAKSSLHHLNCGREVDPGASRFFLIGIAFINRVDHNTIAIAGDIEFRLSIFRLEISDT